MKLMRLLSLLLILVLSASAAVAAIPSELDGRPLPSLAPMLERVTPAVVNIAALNYIRDEDLPMLRDPFFRWFFSVPRHSPRKRKKQSLGSGVIVDAAKGYVLTNHHVVAKADQIEVTLKDGRKFTAELVGADPETDVAVLKIPAERLTAVSFADSDKLRVGDFAVAIGNPFGLTQTVTSGIVSALGRSGLGIEGYENFIQTDASINPGNSGGPLVNLRGELIGINTAILAPSGGNVGIGFAIPINMARAIMDQIIQYGGVNRGLFGIVIQGITPDLAQALGLESRRGALVSEVEAGSPADKAGLRPGDVIINMNGREIKNASDLNIQMALLRIGEKVRVAVIRDGRKRRLATEIADPYAGYVKGEEVHPLFAGALLAEVERGHGVAGVILGKIEEGSLPYRMHLRDDDVLLVVNEERVKSLKDLRRALRKSDRIYMVKLLRGHQVITRIMR